MSAHQQCGKHSRVW